MYAALREVRRLLVAPPSILSLAVGLWTFTGVAQGSSSGSLEGSGPDDGVVWTVAESGGTGAPAEGPATVFSLDGAGWAAIKTMAGPVAIAGVELPGIAGAQTLRLEPFRTLGAGARIVVGSLDGREREIDPASLGVVNYRGSVEGIDGSHVFVSISPYFTTGLIDLGGGAAGDGVSAGTFGVSNIGPAGEELPVGSFSLFTVRTPVLGGMGAGCSVIATDAQMAQAKQRAARMMIGAPWGGLPSVGQVGVKDNGPIKGLRQIQIAVETDFEYFSLFGNLQEAGAYVVQCYAAISDIYVRDTLTRVDVVYVRLWDQPNDLFNELEPLTPFRDYWNANMQSVSRDVAQFFTGRRDLTAGGVAWLNALCTSNGYSWAGYILGFFPTPLEPGAFTRDVIVAAHEIGHNAGTPHTHDLGLDTCDDQAAPPTRGTIMSYCGQTYTGGEGNADARFDTVTAGLINAFVTQQQSACLAMDCNQNGLPDGNDISTGFSLDANGNGVPDECEDCNGNGVLDTIDIATGASADLNNNTIPDECDPDCNNNGVPDDLDLTGLAGTPVFFDTFNTDKGWTLTNLGATDGDWERAQPVNDPTWQHDPTSDADGSGWCLVTDNAAGNSDVDNGATRMTSPQFSMAGGGLSVAYRYYLKMTNPAGVDQLVVEMSSNDLAGPWQVVALHTQDMGLDWTLHVITPGAIQAAGLTQTATMRARFTINDANPQSVVEGGIDAFVVLQYSPPISLDLDRNFQPDDCQPDLDGNGVLDWYQIAQNMALDINRNAILDAYEDCDGDGTPDLAELGAANDVWVAHHDAAGNIKRYNALSGVQSAVSAGTVVATPNDVVVDQATGLVYVSSGADSKVVEFDRHGTKIRDLVASGAGGMSNPGAMMIDGGSLLVVSTGTSSVKRYSLSTGGYLGDAIAGGVGGLAQPFGITKSSAGELLVTSVPSGVGSDEVLRFSAGGSFLGTFVTTAGNGPLSTARGIMFHPDTGNLLVCSFDTDQVLEYNAVTGAFLKQWHSGGTPNPERLWLNNPWCIRLGRDGDIYVSRYAADPESAGTPGTAALHLTNAAIFHYDRTGGHLKRAYVQGLNAGLHHPTGFDFLPGTGFDCNFNQLPDNCDIASGFSQDVNNNGVPDECETLCYADCDGNGSLSIFDYICFGNAYSAQQPYADCDGNGQFNIFDYICFSNLYAAGCP